MALHPVVSENQLPQTTWNIAESTFSIKTKFSTKDEQRGLDVANMQTLTQTEAVLRIDA